MMEENPIQGVSVPKKDTMGQMMNMAKELSPEELQQMIEMMTQMMGGQNG